MMDQIAPVPVPLSITIAKPSPATTKIYITRGPAVVAEAEVLVLDPAAMQPAIAAIAEGLMRSINAGSNLMRVPEAAMEHLPPIRR